MNEVTRTAAQVAADINKVKLNLAVAVVVSSIEIGRLLLEAKALVPHGEWGAWLAANVDFSESKAQSLMRRYKEFGDGQIDMITGTSDLDFFAFLSDSQMDALLALPKPERRDFVEEHREELESGEMSVRNMKAEIAKLVKENDEKAAEIAKLVKENDEKAVDLVRADDYIAELEDSLDGLGELLDKERNKPAPEPIVQETIVYQPSPEKIEEIRAAEEKRLRDEFEAETAKTLKECREEVSRAEKAKEEAEKKAEREANDAGELKRKLKKIEEGHNATLARIKEENDKKLAELEASYKKQAKTSAAGTDANVTRILIAFENFQREVMAVQSALLAMEKEDPNKAAKYKANVEATIGRIFEKVGWMI